MTAMARPALLYFLLWLGVTLSTAMDLEKRIYGGKLCGNNERHYHVKLRIFHKNGEDTCGGSLVKKQWVLTAAHCWEPGEGDTFQVAVPQYPDRLQCINDVPVVPCGPAEDLIQAHCPVIPLANAFCAHDPPRQTAPGDSGGGVLFNRKIYGIVAVLLDGLLLVPQIQLGAHQDDGRGGAVVADLWVP
ncbi:hypothetical protein INR49_028834, partial [Caranx melampygus]